MFYDIVVYFYAKVHVLVMTTAFQIYFFINFAIVQVVSLMSFPCIYIYTYTILLYTCILQ